MNTTVKHTASLDSIWKRNYTHTLVSGDISGNGNEACGSSLNLNSNTYGASQNSLQMNTTTNTTAVNPNNPMNTSSNPTNSNNFMCTSYNGANARENILAQSGVNPNIVLKDQAYSILSRKNAAQDESLSLYRSSASGLSTPGLPTPGLVTPTSNRRTVSPPEYNNHSTPSVDTYSSYSPQQDDYTLDGLMCDTSVDSSEEIIADLKLQVEALTTALTLTSDKPLPFQSAFMQGSSGLEIAHRIMSRLKALREENAHLAAIANGTRAAREEAEKLALVKENAELKAHLGELNRRFRGEL